MKTSTVFFIPGFVLALALQAAAQEKPVTTAKDMTDTVKVTTTGRVVLDYVWRSKEVTSFTESLSTPAGGGGVPIVSEADSENTFEGYVAVGLNIDLSDKVSAVLEFGTKRVDDFDINEWAESFNAGDVVLREAHVNIADFLLQGLVLQAGVSTWSFDVRGRGNSFAFDPRHAQTLRRNVNPLADTAFSMLLRAGTPDELEPVGVWGRYKRETLTFDVVMLPAAIEDGSPSDDEALYAADVWVSLDSIGKGSRVGGIFAISSFGDDFTGAGAFEGTGTSVFTFGGGVDLMFMNGQLEVYGEVYLQTGNAGTTGTQDLDAGGMAFQVGARYSFGGNMAPWIEGNITMRSGDDDDVGPDDEVATFLSYENINDLMIIEDMYFGFDWDSNYFAVKISGGLSFSLAGGKNNFELSGILGICTANEDVQFGAPLSDEDALGTEIDVRARWILTKQASLHAAVGILTGSDVLENSIDSLNGTDDDEDDTARLYTLGADLRF
jgi:hypothetical protein